MDWMGRRDCCLELHRCPKRPCEFFRNKSFPVFLFFGRTQVFWLTHRHWWHICTQKYCPHMKIIQTFMWSFCCNKLKQYIAIPCHAVDPRKSIPILLWWFLIHDLLSFTQSLHCGWTSPIFRVKKIETKHRITPKNMATPNDSSKMWPRPGTGQRDVTFAGSYGECAFDNSLHCYKMGPKNKFLSRVK